MGDKINPDHYKSESGLESIEVIEAFNLNFAEGCIVKYILRYKEKNGLEDLKKCRWYLNRLIENSEKQFFKSSGGTGDHENPMMLE